MTTNHTDILQTVLQEYPDGYIGSNFKQSETWDTISKLSRAEQAELALAMVSTYQQQTALYDEDNTSNALQTARHLLDVILLIINRKLPFTAAGVIEFLDACQQQRFHSWYWHAPIKKLVRNYLQDNDLTSELQTAVETICDSWSQGYGDERKTASQLRLLISAETETLVMNHGDAWSDAAKQTIEALPEAKRSAWIKLIEVCSTATGGKPTAKWLKLATPWRQAVGVDAFQQCLLQWFPLVDRPRTQPLPGWRGGDDVIQDQNADILKGLAWLCSDQTEGELVRALGKLAVSAYRKISGIGPRCVKLGNACVWALGQMPTAEAIGQLALLKVKVKFGTAQKGIEKALTAAAEREGLPREEIEELAVPTYGLSEVGVRRESLGEFTAELEVTGTSSTVLRWIKPDGNVQKSVPKAVKDNHGEDLKELKQAAKDIQKMLPAQRDRIEAFYLQQKTWDLATWQERYLNHPLVGTLARRILWQFEDDGKHAVGIWFEGDGPLNEIKTNLVNLDGQFIDWLTNDTRVSLWHPITASTETIQAWRQWLVTHQIQQPFKQAHREIYLLTAAEENTRIYSNRFAAHIIKQHQFNALCGQRGWKNQLRLMVDDSYEPARLLLPKWDFRAEFWIEGVGDDYGTDTTEAGSYLYLATDQVRFYPIDAGGNYAHAGGGGYGDYGSTAAEPILLTEIPALVLTEVMRDVDLFVGVASVGNDPNWTDGGAEGRRQYYDYWHDYSFGELSATAQTRRQVLENLVPKLKKIADRCSFQERFLLVRGDIRTYKIHLGSGNILMEPNDQYLCIVRAGKSAADQVFLPFEGDKTLALILSKAFLLAADTKITDQTILSQINP
ncbi:DUF4132 domain-containing protein [Leptolyngbya cf. ectocarpi LEGE 11479]|uniref:DUF4132 domain-containing protein n=1 Tax=Leptolyngbya cf. ectocarpi LEGE 11479 TaxID=1828722 RepID=A0A928ZU07_LEPEC|nr:DUF4132 domain-containing protein [Leptolyngbya ectocarpi]MBE9067425.1 DUF4132 domain-containing protein [Leptolyngbya cf. ectocarpi LEGE 11479]